MNPTYNPRFELDLDIVSLLKNSKLNLHIIPSSRHVYGHETSWTSTVTILLQDLTLEHHLPQCSVLCIVAQTNANNPLFQRM